MLLELTKVKISFHKGLRCLYWQIRIFKLIKSNEVYKTMFGIKLMQENN